MANSLLAAPVWTLFILVGAGSGLSAVGAPARRAAVLAGLDLQAAVARCRPRAS